MSKTIWVDVDYVKPFPVVKLSTSTYAGYGVWYPIPSPLLERYEKLERERITVAVIIETWINENRHLKKLGEKPE